MAWQLHYASVGGKFVVTAEPHEVPVGAAAGHVVPLDGHVAVTIPDGILAANQGKDYLGREIRTRVLQGVRRLTSVLPAAEPETFAVTGRRELREIFQFVTTEFGRLGPMYLGFNKLPMKDSAGWIVMFYVSLLRMWDSSSYTDTERLVLLDAAREVDNGQTLFESASGDFESPLEAKLHDMGGGGGDMRMWLNQDRVGINHAGLSGLAKDHAGDLTSQFLDIIKNGADVKGFS